MLDVGATPENVKPILEVGAVVVKAAACTSAKVLGQANATFLSFVPAVLLVLIVVSVLITVPLLICM